jgi:hypothetical protein
MRKQKELLNTPFINEDKKSEGFKVCGQCQSNDVPLEYLKYPSPLRDP